ncbi:RNA 2',3'-cyclic phosphodiesterase [Domibacillus iocasae]|uniref:RNA 2',3'-cyclic phosphodiesterase n=1 Tax=Domibacillus iocasae TaxID=1714016 RepID=A0A1E7DNL3_9BACI|nr:RNA 2',3'-cyclic phosphodiesterase [Domibacillus iocasae]OES44639.1 2'-5' RNA ligase [Domibacillus iocasae]
MQPHYFFAIVLPDHVKKMIADEMKKRNDPFKRMVHEEDYHLTLAFVGAAKLSVIKEACDMINEKIGSAPVFSIKLSSFGTFGQKKSPRIFWIGTDEPAPLFHVQKEVASACRKSGINIDEKPFRPHITTARKWIGQQPYSLAELPDWPPFSVTEVALYETNTSTVPKYMKKWSCILGKPRGDTSHGSIN